MRSENVWTLKLNDKSEILLIWTSIQRKKVRMKMQISPCHGSLAARGSHFRNFTEINSCNLYVIGNFYKLKGLGNHRTKICGMLPRLERKDRRTSQFLLTAAPPVPHSPLILPKIHPICFQATHPYNYQQE